MNWRVACVLLAAIAVDAQDLRSIERELQAKYVGKNLTLAQPYHASKITFGLDGRIVGRPTTACDADLPLHIDSLSLTKDVLSLKGSRSPSHQVLMERSTGKPVHRPPAPKAQHVELRLLSGGIPWEIAKIDHALDQIERGPAANIPNPPGATPAPAGADRRILYILPQGPVYKVGGGVSQPTAISTPDPEYSDEARKAKLCGSVEMKMVVLTDGRTAHVRAATPNIDHGLDEKSVEAIRQWRFTPGQMDGHPVITEVIVTTSFRLY